MKIHWFGKTGRDTCEYAGEVEFARIFECERAGLRKLALLLTADEITAERCLARAFRECSVSSSVCREWALSWARRMVVRSAIDLVMGPEGRRFANTSSRVDNGRIGSSVDGWRTAIAGPEWILGLPAIDRLVFVICVLERYSVHDCALLLSRAPREISEARQRVDYQATQIEDYDCNPRGFAMR